MTGNIRRIGALVSVLFVIFLLSACNLQQSPEVEVTVTQATVDTSQATSIGFIPTALNSGQATPIPLTITTPSLFPTVAAQVPITIDVSMPEDGQLVSGSVAIMGTVTHPDFLQYQLEYAPNPNSVGTWNAIGTVVQIPVVNGILGTWDTNTVADGDYQLQLDVVLHDGSNLIAGVNNIHVQNHLPTSVPTATALMPRPLASFTENPAAGIAPLTVSFANLSSGYITSFQWNFGDGNQSSDYNPVHTFNSPRQYTVTLTVSGPGGQANISNPINVQGQAVPNAAFTADRFVGVSPLTVKFINQSSGSFTNIVWNFGDGTFSNNPNPSHTFTGVGTYNVILTVSGSGGSSTTLHEVNVQNQTVAAPVARFNAVPNHGQVPLTVNFVNQSTGTISQYTWNFGDGTVSAMTSPTHKFTQAGNHTVTLIAVGPGGQSKVQAVIAISPLPTATPNSTPIVPTATPSKPKPTPTLKVSRTPIVPSATPTAKPKATTTAVVTQVANNPTLTSTAIPASDTPTVLPTATPIPPTATAIPSATASITPIPASDTPTATAIPPTATDTATLEPPKATATPTSIPPTKTLPPDLSDTQPVIPDLSNAQLQANLKTIFQAGTKAGNQPSIFALAGDESATEGGYLEPFANPQGYTLDDNTQALKGIIDWYNQTPLNGNTSFNRHGLASKAGWTVHDLVDASKADSGQCQPQERPLGCELRLTKASVVIISVGANDVLQGTDPQQFRADLRMIIMVAVNHGAIPVFTTIAPRLDGKVTSEQTRAYNNIIIQVANNNNIPVINLWRILTQQPNNGLNGDQVSLSIAPNGAGDLRAEGITFGLNRRNTVTLRTLNVLRTTIFPKAAP